MHRRYQASGLAFLEVLVLITVFAIATVFVLPRFFRPSAYAHQEMLNELAATILANSALAHSIAAVRHNSEQIIFSGREINMYNKYPSSAPEGITRTLSHLVGIDVTYNQHQVHFSPLGAKNPDRCIVSYTQAIVIGKTPTVLVDTSDCS